ncbi:MAG TPA: ABC transporter ATP-binding protein [Methylomirabilota bacterium]|nr:ABC transporter ATP-binding protein [Methylomirabilota bacterium]
MATSHRAADGAWPVLAVEGLVAGYGAVQVLRGVALTVGRGEVVALLGANGSGKSTALNTISGFIRPTAGRIRLDGVDITGRPPHWTFRHGVVQVSQGRDLFPDMSVEDNLRLGAAVRGDAKAALPRVYELFPRLAARRRQVVRLLSGGEQQMVAIGRALVSEPVLLLLDEPSGGLAPVFVAEIGRVVTRLRTGGTTVLMVEQNIRLALAVADRFVALRDGELLAGGPVGDLRGGYEDLVRRIYL